MWVRYEKLERAEISINEKYIDGFTSKPILDADFNIEPCLLSENDDLNDLAFQNVRFLIRKDDHNFEMMIKSISENMFGVSIELCSLNRHFKMENIPYPSKKGIYIAIQTPNCRKERNPDELAQYPLDFECPALKRMIPLENLNCFGNKIFLY